MRDFRNQMSENKENEFTVGRNGTPTNKTQGLKKELKKNVFCLNIPASLKKKKNLAERIEERLSDSSPTTYSLHSYDPITNYTSPRPKFLRYNPNQRKQLLRRIEGEKIGDEKTWSGFYPNNLRERVDEIDYEGEEETEKEKKPLHPFAVCILLLIFGVLLSFACFMGSTSSEDYERSVDINQKIQGNAPLKFVRKRLFPENLLGDLYQMCPISGKSTCNLEEYGHASFNVDQTGDGIRREISNKSEVLVVGVQDLNNGGLLYNHSVVKEIAELDEQDQMNSEPLDKSIVGVDTLKESSNAFSSVEPLLDSVAQVVSCSSFTNRNEKVCMDMLELEDPLLTSKPDVDQDFPKVFIELNEFEFLLNSKTELKSAYGSSILSEEALHIVFVLLGLLIIVVGLSSCFHKYIRRRHWNSRIASPSSSSYEFGMEAQIGGNVATVVPMMEEDGDKCRDILVENRSSGLNGVPFRLDPSQVEFKKLSVGPPRVELLGEFSLMDGRIHNDILGSKLKEMEYPISQFLHYRKSRAVEMFSSSSDMLESSPMKSISNRFSTKVIVEKGEASDTSTTPLRRSSRLRK